MTPKPTRSEALSDAKRKARELRESMSTLRGATPAPDDQHDQTEAMVVLATLTVEEMD